MYVINHSMPLRENDEDIVIFIALMWWALPGKQTLTDIFFSGR